MHQHGKKSDLNWSNQRVIWYHLTQRYASLQEARSKPVGV